MSIDHPICIILYKSNNPRYSNEGAGIGMHKKWWAYIL
jgi:hypothetical protein